MENLKELRIIAYRTKTDDFLGTVTLYNQKTMFQFVQPLLGDCEVRFENDTVKDYLEKNNLIDEFIDLVNQAIDSNDFKVV